MTQFSDLWREKVGEALDAAVNGASELGALTYVERLLTAFDEEPPKIWRAPASSGASWLELGPWEKHAWNLRIEQWREGYGRVVAGNATEADLAMVHEHACEAAYGDPAYGGNQGGKGWQRIKFPEPDYPPSRTETDPR